VYPSTVRIDPLVVPTVCLAIALFWIGASLARRTSSKSSRTWLLLAGVLLAIPGVLFVAYYVHVLDNAAWFYNLRAVPGSELAASGIGLLAGVVYACFEPQTVGEKLAIPTLAGALLLVPYVKPILDPLDLERLADRCPGEVCMQSTPSTSGPASAATILRSFGIEASERQLAQESFTYRGGTENWYLARALRRRGLDVEAHIQSPIGSPPAPSIAGVLLRGGAGHFIALMSETSDEITIGDPLKGKLVIRKAHLADYYHFTGFFLEVRRQPTAEPSTHP
jgi:hypothetical protein